MQQTYNIDRSSGNQPVYRQLSLIIKEEIRNYYATGDMLPSEKTMAQRFQVNRHTVRRAMEELIRAGYINRIHGKGSVVLKAPVDYAIHPATRFTETLESQGRRTVSRVLEKCRIAVFNKAAQKLELQHGSFVIFLRTMRIVDACVFCVSSHYFPSPEFDFILDNYNGGSLHRFISGHSGKRLKRTASLISASTPGDQDRLLLNIPKSVPVLKVKSVNVDRLVGSPCEYVVTQFRGDAIQLSVKP